MPYCITFGIMYCHLLIWCCFWFILYPQFLNVSTNLYKTVHYVRAIEILHFWQLIINVFLVILSFLGVVINLWKGTVSKPGTRGCPSLGHSGPPGLGSAGPAGSGSPCPAGSGSCRPGERAWSRHTGTPGSAATAQKCPPGK